MLHIVIDTTALRSDPARKKAAFQSLKQLVQAGKAQIYISYVVKQEFISQEKELYKSHLQPIIANIQHLRKKVLPDSVIKLLDESLNNFKSIEDKSDSFIEDEFNSWCKEMSIQILPVNELHGNKVIQSYFLGDPPFKTKKSRADFPDAFIYQSILDLSPSLKEVYVVTNDNNLSDALKKTSQNIVTFNTLEDLIESDFSQKLIKELEEREAYNHKITIIRDAINSILKNESIVYLIESELAEEFKGTFIKSRDIPNDNHQAKIDYLGNIEGPINFHYEQISYYGLDYFSVPFNLKIETRLSYLLNKKDYWSLDQEQMENMVIDERNDYTYSVDEDYSMEVEGRISIRLDSDIVEKLYPLYNNSEKLFKEAEIEIDVIDKVSVIPYPNSD
ncbi:MAG TPA: PIN domain-containing protein [Nostocaceae cyanobacterium]|nr:PIN domain-containing protein [Nostocaceae cyanobacterium]